MMNEMNCKICRNLLHGYLDNELDTATAALVAQHLATCAACQRKYQQIKILIDDIKEHAPYYEAPPALIENICADPLGDKTSMSKTNNVSETVRNILRKWYALIISAVAVAAAVITIYIAIPSDEENEVNEAVSNHIRSLMPGHLIDVSSADKLTVKPWFNGKIDFSPPVNDFSSQGYALLGGRLDYLDNQITAAIPYQHDKHIINTFISSTEDDDSKPESESNHGYNVVFWNQNHMCFIIVSDLDANELMKFSQLVRGHLTD